jgi:hypothetical protein
LLTFAARRLGLALIACLVATGCFCTVVDPPQPATAARVDESALQTSFRAELIPSELRNRVGIENYAVNSQPTSTDIAFSIINLTTTETFVFELAAVFEDAGAQPIHTTAWRRVELKPGHRHHFRAETSDRGVRGGAGLIRQVVTLDSNEQGR